MSTATPRGKVTAVIGFPCFSETDSLSWSCGRKELIVGAKDKDCTDDKDQDARIDVPAFQGWSSRRSCSHMQGQWLGRSAPRVGRSAKVEEGEAFFTS